MNEIGQVKAMFVCRDVKPQQGSTEPTVHVTFFAGFGSYLTNKGLPDKDANTDWAKYTPSGELWMTINNPNLVDHFEMGEVYELTIKKVSK